LTRLVFVSAWFHRFSPSARSATSG
jgi:hypothetical protein